ncbi:MAG TPA: hypothetical protein VKE41_08120 [Roseiflexaceae bacterium]|nr:hypothetical protein [Roseiflexaceae bacterium]
MAGVEHLAPVAQAAETTHDRVMPDCTQDGPAALEPSAEERYNSSTASDYEPFYAVDPFAEFEADHIALVIEHIPPGELAIQRRTQVIASDGSTGEVSAFVVDRASGGDSSIVVRLDDWLTKCERAKAEALAGRHNIDLVVLTSCINDLDPLLGLPYVITPVRRISSPP